MPKAITTKPVTSTVLEPDTYVTCKEAAQLLHLSEIHVRDMLTKKKLRRFKVGTRTLISKKELMGLIREGV